MKIYLRKKRIRIIIAVIFVAVALVLIFGNVYGHWWKEAYRILKTWGFDSENKNVLYGQVVFVGDSITDYCDLERYYPDFLAYNRGIASDTTDGLLKRMNQSIFDLKPSVIVLLIGINDFVFCDGGVGHIEANYNEILMQIKEKLPDATVVVQSCYPVASGQYPNHFKAYKSVPVLNERIEALALKYGYIYVDVYSSLVTEDGTLNLQYTDDGLHPNDNGYKVISSVLNPVIKGILGI